METERVAFIRLSKGPLRLSASLKKTKPDRHKEIPPTLVCQSVRVQSRNWRILPVLRIRGLAVTKQKVITQAVDGKWKIIIHLFEKILEVSRGTPVLVY